MRRLRIGRLDGILRRYRDVGESVEDFTGTVHIFLDAFDTRTHSIGLLVA